MTRTALGLFGAGCLCVLALAATLWWSPGSKRSDLPAAGMPGLDAAIAGIERGSMSTPLVEALPDGKYVVTFLARRDGLQVPRIVSDVTGWGERADGTFDTTVGTMTPAGLAGWYAVRAVVAPAARIEYLVSYGVGDVRIDPHNPRQSHGPQLGGAPASELVTPGYVTPAPFAEPPVPGGSDTESVVHSAALHAPWRVAVHLPPGVRAADSMPVVVFVDRRAAQVARVIDRLVAYGELAPVLAAFVGPVNQSGAHPDPSALRVFLTAELPRWLERRYGPAWREGRRGIVGVSFHARDALDAALACRTNPPERAAGCAAPYDRVGLLLPGRRITAADIPAFARRAEPARTVAVLAGSYDQANIETARRLKLALTGVGHTVHYREVPEGHSAVTWTHHLGSVLVSLFGPPGGVRRTS
jgi:enterochelin esterase-like enzyme